MVVLQQIDITVLLEVLLRLPEQQVVAVVETQLKICPRINILRVAEVAVVAAILEILEVLETPEIPLVRLLHLIVCPLPPAVLTQLL
jgi:hypothetical protein